MNFNDQVLALMKADPTHTFETACAEVQRPSVEAAAMRDREAAERSRTHSDAASDGALRLCARFPAVDVASARVLAREVQSHGGNGAPLDVAIARHLAAEVPPLRALELARAEVASGKGPSAAPASAAELSIRLAQLDPTLDPSTALPIALKLRAQGPGAIAGALLALKDGATLTAAVSHVCGRA